MPCNCAAPRVSQCHPPPKNVNASVVEEGGPGCIEEQNESWGNHRNPLGELNMLQKEEYNFICKLYLRYVAESFHSM